MNKTIIRQCQRLWRQGFDLAAVYRADWQTPLTEKTLSYIEPIDPNNVLRVDPAYQVRYIRQRDIRKPTLTSNQLTQSIGS